MERAPKNTDPSKASSKIKVHLKSMKRLIPKTPSYETVEKLKFVSKPTLFEIDYLALNVFALYL